MPSMCRFFLRRYRLFAPYLFRHGLVLLLLLLLGDAFSVLYFPQLRTGLSLKIPPTSSPTTSTISPGLAEMNTGPGAAMLANDTFQRPDQRFWGTASDGHPWQADASNEQNFVIFHHAGVIEATPTRIVCNALLGPEVENVDITFTAALGHYGSSTLGAVVRWSDARNFYALILDGHTLALNRTMDGMQIPLQSVSFPARDGAPYTFRLRAAGAQLFAMVWPTGQPAPTNWQLTVSDSAFSQGQAGLRAVVQHGTQARITAFEEVRL